MGEYDFSGWATRNDLTCGDGRVIRRDAFKSNDGKKVPLVWGHKHDNVECVLGHALLENREEGVYAYCTFNETETGQAAKKLVQHGDVTALSIWANNLKQQGNNVIHGMIRELSLVLAGANPGAFIDTVLAHSEDNNSDEDAMIINFNENLVIHSADEPEKKAPEQKKEESKEMADEKKPEGKSVKEVIDTMNEEQQNVVYGLVGQLAQAIEDEGDDDNEDEENGGDDMKHNLFDKETEQGNALSHDAMNAIIGDAKRCGTMKQSFIEHSAEYGIENIDYLLPDARTVNPVPEFIQRDTGWVSNFMGKTKHTPFSRIKSMFANITEDDARAKGYIKGNLKKEEVFSLLKRTTSPCTVYKKQKMDHDDIKDITDFNVVAWIKSEMRLMLDEEIARAALIGDGRLASSDDKINEENIRPIYKDAALYSVKVKVELASADTDDQKTKKIIRKIVKSRKEYKGSGNPILYTTEDFVTDCLLMEDAQGRVIYETIDKLKTALRVSDIVTVEVMEGVSRTGVQAVDGDTSTRALIGIIVNPIDYNIGADKGGAIDMFEDFDIDYNQQKYLIETRCSGALVKPYSALVIESVTA